MMKMIERMARIEDGSIPEPNSGCWLWARSTDGRYGILSINGRLQKAHRVSFEASRGAIPDGMKVLHRCDVTYCVNPDHLFLGTQADNIADMSRKGRNPMQTHPERSSLCGHKRSLPREQHGRTKLSAARVLEMRAMHARGLSTRALGKLFGVHGSHAAKLVKGARNAAIKETESD